MTKLTALAVDNLDLLHEIDSAPGTARAVADRLGRDESNLSKTLKKLRDDGVIGEGASLTDAGRTITRVLTADGELQVSGDEVLRRWDQLEPDPQNERKHVDLDGLASLKASLLTHGQLQNLIIRPGTNGPAHSLDIIVVGASRWRAIGDAIADGLWDAERPLRCRLVTGADAKQLMLTRLAENLHRTDLHRLDEGAGYVRLRDEFNLDAHAISAAVGKSPKHVADHIALVEKLPDDAKARMYLPDGHADQLRYVDARRIVQGLNAKPKPAVDVDPKEALVLLEIAHRAKARPSHDPLANGRDGWTKLSETLEDSLAARALLEKGLIEGRELEDHAGTRYFVRVAPDKATDVAHWIADQGAMALWSARIAVLGQGVVGGLEQSGRYATPWLNDPLPEPEPAPASPPPAPPAGNASQIHPALPVASPEGEPAPEPDPLTPTQRRILREIAGRSIHRHRLLDGWVLAHASALTDPDFQVLWDLAFIIRRQAGDAEIEVALTLSGRDHLKARGQAPQDGLSRNSCATPCLRETPPNSPPEGEGDGAAVESEQHEPRSDDDLPASLLKLAGVPETHAPRAAAFDVPELSLTADELTILADVGSKIAAEPLGGRPDPTTGKPAFTGCAVGAYHKDGKAIRLVTELRLLAFVPSARDVQMCVLTARAKAWLAANPQPPTKPPYATAWLNPPAKAPPPPAEAGEAARPQAGTEGAQGGAHAATAQIYFAKPIISPPSEFTCGNCEKDFEVSGEIETDELVESSRFDDDVVQGDYFRPPAAFAQCPHCQAALTLLCAEVYLVKAIG